MSPKLTMSFGPWAGTELFLNAGDGFHSNDARGTTITVDPTDGVTSAQLVDPLVKARGAEVGVRTRPAPGLQLAASLWTLGLDSELLFVGDGGTTEASRKSRRSGLELSAYYRPARLADPRRGSGAVARALRRQRSGGQPHSQCRRQGCLAGNGGQRALRLVGWPAHALPGPAALIEDNSVRSSSTTLLNAQLGYQFTPGLKGVVEVLNVLDERANDITYFYESQLRGEPAPVGDIHFHPVEPRTMRATLTMRF